jgi:hypothetical protein
LAIASQIVNDLIELSVFTAQLSDLRRSKPIDSFLPGVKRGLRNAEFTDNVSNECAGFCLVHCTFDLRVGVAGVTHGQTFRRGVKFSAIRRLRASEFKRGNRLTYRPAVATRHANSHGKKSAADRSPSSGHWSRDKPAVALEDKVASCPARPTVVLKTRCASFNIAVRRVAFGALLISG